MAVMVEEPEVLVRSTRFRPKRMPGITIAVSLGLVALVVLAALFGSFVEPHDPGAQDLSLVYATPSLGHLLGTDELGRDVFSRVIAGGRFALTGPAIVAVGAMLVGSFMGLYAGYRKGAVDTVLMRGTDLLMAVPPTLVILVVAGVFGGGYWTAVTLFTVQMIPIDARIARGVTMAQVPRAYVEAARTLGVSHRRIMIQHIWPNISPAVIAQVFLNFAAALVGLGSLSFLGVGASPGAPDWGAMLSAAEASLFQNPIACLAPGAAIILLAASMNIIGDWLFDKISLRAVSR